MRSVGRDGSHVRGRHAHPRPCLQVNPPDLIEADVGMAPVIQLRDVRPRVIGHCRGVPSVPPFLG